MEKMSLKQLGIHMQKKKKESIHRPYTCHKINSKWITDLHVNYKDPKRKTGENLSDLGFSNDF